MPFDGSAVLPGSPLAILLEADRKLTAERRAAAKLRARPVPSAKKSARRTALAREAVIVLHLLEDLLGDEGQHWMRNAYADGLGSYCLVGGLRRIRAIPGFGDHAGIYLRRSISKISRGKSSIIRFNDSRAGYTEIRAAILLARQPSRGRAGGMTRREFLKACGLVAVGTALMRPVRALARRAEPEPATLPPDSAYERMKRLRIDYMLAVGDPQRRYAINREFIALAFEMKAAGASRADTMTMGQATLFHAKREVARLRALA